MDLPVVVVSVVASAISLTDGGSALMMSPGMGNSWHRGGHGGACGVETQHTFFVIFGISESSPLGGRIDFKVLGGGSPPRGLDGSGLCDAVLCAQYILQLYHMQTCSKTALS